MANFFLSTRFFPPIATGTALLALLLTAACSKEEKPAASKTATPAAADSPVTAASTTKTPVTPEDRIIAKARAALGAEDKLLALQTLKMTGTIYNEKNEVLGLIHLFFKKPASQRSEFIPNAQQTIIEASNGLEGWTAAMEKGKGARFNMLQPANEQQSRFTAMENVYFYRAAELVRGSEVTSEGPVEYRDAKCWKVSFHYPNSITYVRYFDDATGDLRGTILQPAGTEFVEEGKKTVEGIVFPTTLRSYSKDGKLTQLVKFDTVEINQPMDDRLFEVPSLIALRAAGDLAKAAGTSNTPTPGKPASSSATPTPALKVPPLTSPSK